MRFEKVSQHSFFNTREKKKKVSFKWQSLKLFDLKLQRFYIFFPFKLVLLVLISYVLNHLIGLSRTYIACCLRR